MQSADADEGCVRGAASRTRKVLLDVGLVWEGSRDLLEDFVMQWKPVAQLSHHLEVVDHPVGRLKWLELLW